MIREYRHNVILSNVSSLFHKKTFIQIRENKT